MKSCRIGIVAFAIIIILYPSLARADSPVIAVVHSYHDSFKWVGEVNKGIADYINGADRFGIKADALVKDYNFVYFYMNAKAHQGDDKELSAIGRKIIGKLKLIKPVVTMISDDEALKFVAKPLMDDSNFKFVFFGVNNNPRDYGVVENFESPEHNVTGLVSKHPFEYSLKLITSIVPNYKNIYVFFDDSYSGKGILKDLNEALVNIPTEITSKIKDITVSNDWSLWKNKILKTQNPKNIYIIGTFYALHEDNRVLSEKEVIEWIVKNSVVPEIAVVSSHVKDGLLLTISNPGYVHGYEGCSKVAELLHNKLFSQIPIETPKTKAVHINMKRADRIHLKIPANLIALSRYFDEFGY